MTTSGNAPLAGQSSVFSLTIDELQSIFAEFGMDFGSMSMEDLLMNKIWMVDNQASTSSAGARNGVAPLTLSRTLSQKTVDELRSMYNSSSTGTNGGDCSSGGSSLSPRQNDFGEITLEEFLVRAGVASKEPQQPVNPNVAAFYGALAQPCTNNSFFGRRILPAPNHNVLSNQFLVPTIYHNTGKQTIAPVVEHGPFRNVLASGVTAKKKSVIPPVSVGEGGRGRRPCTSSEEAIARRHERMIKNRESASRSRARKQASTVQLENQVTDLKENNDELKKKQAEIDKKDKNKMLEMRMALGRKRGYLKRTLSSPW